MGKRINRIDLADYRDVDQLVNGILRLIPDLQPPIPIEDLARDLDIEDIKTLEAKGFVGALITDADKSSGVILVKHDVGDHRRRFTIGHELGHFLCPTHIPLKNSGFYCTSGDMGLSQVPKSNIAGLMEVQANRFSARLLMPEKLVRSRMPSKKDPHIQQILDLCEIFQTSKETTARRYVDVQDALCAVVMSKDLKVRYPYRNDEFPYLPVSKGDPLPHGSLSAKAGLAAGHLSEAVDVDPSVWLDDRQAGRVECLIEQVLVQSDGYRITLLTAELNDEDD